MHSTSFWSSWALWNHETCIYFNQRVSVIHTLFIYSYTIKSRNASLLQ
jgi:hypothetical protein